MSRSDVVPPRPSHPARPSLLLAVLALVLGACSFFLFDAGRVVMGMLAGIPALIAVVAAFRHWIRPPVIHVSR